MQKYNFEKLKEAILFNTVEVLPNNGDNLDQEIHRLIDLSEDSGEAIKHYIGFEISGQIHIGTGLASGLKLKKLQDAGVEITVWLADYHTWLNKKLDGKLETITKIRQDYFEPVLRECFKIVGCDTDKIHFLVASEEYNNPKNNKNYWTTDMLVSEHLTLSRVLKSISVTGKIAGNDVNFTTLRYAPMQVADCFFLGTHLVHAGIDQRKCHVLMREVAPKLNYENTLKLGGKTVKPIAIHHGLLLGLGKPINGELAKMSKSKPDSAIWVHDSPEEIKRKLKKAYCPIVDTDKLSMVDIEKEQINNPLLNWCEMLIFPASKELHVKRDSQWGGDLHFTNFQDLKVVYFSGDLHPSDLKNGVADCLIEWFEPIRHYTKQNPKGLDFLLKVK